MIVCNNSGVEQCQPRGIFRAAHQPGNQLNRFLQIVDVVDKQGVALTLESRQNSGAQQRGLARARFGEQTPKWNRGSNSAFAPREMSTPRCRPAKAAASSSPKATSPRMV
jgi:hypothetical protein